MVSVTLVSGYMVHGRRETSLMGSWWDTCHEGEKKGSMSLNCTTETRLR